MPCYSGIVQSVEQRTVNPYVTGSSPVARAKISADFCGFFNVFHTSVFLTKTYQRSQIYPKVRYKNIYLHTEFMCIF